MTIMDAVERLLGNRPYAELRVEDVMSVSGLTRTAFYRYFPDLESVLLALLASVRTELAEGANRWLLSGTDPHDGLFDAHRELARVWCRHRALMLAFGDAATTGSRIQAAWHDMVESFVEPVESRFAELRLSGLISLEHPAETARALVWMDERYLFETFARRRDVSVEVAAATLTQTWRRVLFSGPPG